MKKIVISISDGMVERNLLKTDFLNILLKQEDFKIFFVCSDKELFDYLKKEYSSLGINVIFKPYRINKIDAAFAYIFQNSIHTKTVKENQYNCWQGFHRRQKINLPTFIFFRILWMLGKSRLWVSFIRFVYRLNPNGYCKDLLLDINPDLVFITSISPSDYKLLHQSKKLGFKAIQMIKSWDNLTSKTFLRIIPDGLIVHNGTMKKEAMILYGMPEYSIYISGIPQFDYLFKNSDKLFAERKQFYSSIGIDYRKKIILYSVSGDIISPNDEELILIINDAIRNKLIDENVHIQVRLHPKYNSAFGKLNNLKSSVTIERPFSYLDQNSKKWVFSEKDMAHWYNSIYHSAMVVNVASSMAIDSSVLDRPVICIGFDGYNKLPYERSVIRYYDREHFKNLILTNGASLVRSKEELINEINFYLKDISRKKKERSDLVFQQCYKLDGQSSSRIVDFLKLKLKK